MPLSHTLFQQCQGDPLIASDGAPPLVTDRRSLLRGAMLGGAGAMAAMPLAACATPQMARTPAFASGTGPGRMEPSSTFGWQDPAENLRMLSRMWGTIAEDEAAYLYVFGPAFGLRDATSFVPLFRLESLAVVRTITLPGGAFRYLANQVILFCDFKTNEVLETWDNPYTGERNEVFHYRDGPLDYVLDPNKLAERYALDTRGPLDRSLVLEWFFRGEHAYGDAIARTTLPNKLDPEEWPRASVGPTWQTFEVYRWQAKMREMEDLSLPSVPSFHGDFQTFKPWEPWMLMGQTPGSIFSVRTAFKPKSFDEVPRHVVDYIEKNLPDYLTPPTQLNNAYELNDTHYRRLREPVTAPLPPLRNP